MDHKHGMGQMGANMGSHGPMQGATMGEGEPGHMAHGMMPMMQMEPGLKSESGKYWCVMCKKFFELDEPVCPYMPQMCINTPLAVETLPPGSTLAFERIGLYYPKIIQRLNAVIMPHVTDHKGLGEKLAEDYLGELEAWKVKYRDNPLEALKSFIIYYSGADVATRNTDKGIIFYLVDASIIWGKEMHEKKRVKMVLLAGINYLKSKLGLEREFDVHFMDMNVEEPGRFYCEKCNMFFEFGTQQDTVTCPFMPQKCKFKPHKLIESKKIDLGILTKVYKLSPKLYRRFLESTLTAAPGVDRQQLHDVLVAELDRWNMSSEPEKVAELKQVIGL